MSVALQPLPGLAAPAAPMAVTPSATLGVPATSMIGQAFSFTVTFDNLGTGSEVGYGPFVDLFLPIGGADGTSASGPNDGISFVNAQYLGTGVTSTTATCSPGGTVTHPLIGGTVTCPALPGGFDSSFTWQFVNLVLPFGSFTPDQPPAPVTVNVNLSNFADLGVALPIQARGGFRYGADPLDNPGADPPIVQSPFAQASVTPTVIRLTKSYNGPENETATGPNFPRQYTITVDIAAGQTVTNLDVTDYLPGNVQFVAVVSTSPSATCGTLPSTTTPGGTLVCTFASVTGTTSASDATVTFSFYIPLNDANGNPVINAATGDDAVCENNAGALGNWTPLDPRDTSGSATAGGSGAPPEHVLGCKSIAVQKSVVNLTDSTNSPGDVLEYTLALQVSDFFAFQNVRLVDVLGDGLRFQSSFAPTLEVNGNSFVLSAAGMDPANVDVVCNYTGGPGPECDADDPAANNGQTTITFYISAELVTRGRPNGQLLGGCVPTGGGSDYDCDPYNDGPTTATLRFRAVIQDQYSDDYPSGDPSVDQGDVLNNSVTASGDVLNNADLTPTGSSEDDTSSTSVRIAQGNLQKTIYARNGVACSPQPCSNVQVTSGDTVTFRLRYTHPTSSFENFSITDFLPLPVFNATQVTSFSNAICGVPAAGAACLGPADTYHTLTSPVPPPPTMTTSAANNSVAFTYGNYDNPADPSSVVDLLFTVTVQDQPFADGLFLTNQARSVEGTTQQSVRTVDSIVQLQVLGPAVGLRKGIVATDKATATFSPTTVLPANVTVSPPGSSCPRISGSGLPVNSGNLGATFDSNLTGVDAGDLVTFAIVLENTGRGPNGAFDVRVRDDLPAGFVVPSGGINLCATDGTGAPFTVTDLGGGLLGSGIELNDPGPTNPPAGALDPGRLPDGTVITTGRNIAIITFDLQVAASAQPNQSIVNTATLFNFAGQEGGANFAVRTDTASTTIAVPILTKFLVASSEAHTVQPLILADFTNAGFDGWTPGSEITGGTNTWQGNTTPFPHFLRIAGTATERGGGFFTYTAPNYLDLRGYNTIGLLVRPLADNAATPLWIRLTDADGTVHQLNMAASPTAGLPGFAQLVSSGTLLAPSSIVAAGTTPGLNLAQITKLELRGDNGTSAMRMDIDRIVALRTLAAPGEIVRFRLVAQIPEGTLPDFALFDSIPAGMRFINDNTVRVAFVANGGGITSAAAGSGAAAVPALAGAGLNLTGSGDNVSALSLAVGGPNGLLIGEGTSFDANVSSSRTADSDTYADDTDVWFRLGTLTNSDSDADAEYVVLEFNALVTNDRNATATDGSAQQAGISLSNSFQVRLNSSTTNVQVGSASTGNDFQAVIIVEPQINNLGKAITTLPVDAGDPIAYQIKFSNNTAHPAQYAPQVRAATTAPFSAAFNPTGGVGGTGRFTGAPATVDGVTLAEGDRVLVKDQATASQNGIYKVVDAVNGIWDRATDFDTAAEMTLGYRAYVAAGTTNGGRTFALDAAVATINTSPVTFSAVAANPAARVATTGNLANFSAGTFTGVSATQDGVTLAVGDRVLVRAQSTAAQNGVYVVTSVGGGTMNLARAADFDTAAEFPVGIQVYVIEGVQGGGRTFAQVSSVATLNTSAINWVVVDQVTAFDLVLTDVLPPSVLFQSVTIVTPDIPAGQTFTANGTFTGGSVTVPAVNTSGTITVNLDRLDPEVKIAGAVKDVTITVNGVVSGSAAARQEIVNTARLTFTSLPGPRGTANNPTGTNPTTSSSVDDSGGQYGERNGSGITATDNTPVNYATSVRNNYSVASTVITTLARPTVDKAFKDGTLTGDDTSVPGTAGANVAVGEQVTYDILVTLPEGATPGVVVNDVVPAGLRLDSYAVITLAGGSGMLTGNFNGTLGSNPPAVSPALPVTGPNTVSFTFSNSSVTADGNPNNNAFVLRLTATVLNIMANQNGVTRTNTATLRFDDPALPARTVPDSNLANDPTVAVVEPELSITKTQLSVSPSPAQLGSVITYRITVAHAGTSTAPAYDVAISDVVPAALTLNLSSVTVTLNGNASGAVNNSAGNTVSVSVAAIPNDGVSSVQVDYQATVTGNADLNVTNTGDARWTSTPGSNPDERNGNDGLLGSGQLNDYRVIASTTLVVPLDFGDLPSSYDTLFANNGARHLVNGLKLGVTVQTETNAKSPLDATGDGAEEDGVSIYSPSADWGNGTGAFLVTVVGGNGCLNIWMDFTNDAGSGVGPGFADGNFVKTGGYDTYIHGSTTYSEHIVQNLPVTTGVNNVAFPVPPGVLGTQSNSYYFRFRLSPRDSGGNCTATVAHNGFVFGGEVEDHRFTFSPLAVAIASFTAEAAADGVALTWETTSEVDNVGFRVLRSGTPEGERELLAFVPSAAPGGAAGARYRYVDATAQPGQVYWYWLEAVDAAGATTLHGPVSAQASSPLPRRLWLPLVTR
ncbi:MAG: isopeptide-forming domain-containing fimbrial protein [Caldilineales bacterium]|nr:isopeptide-forming domain-containing fimbrial protein [Caldilineales bacterium]